jgi:DNA invertase Pin-like site-specific DNA recombinase
MNCLLYARVSTDKQAQKDLSIPAQLEAMKQHARKNGWKIAGHFVDEGESAKTANRPELKKLIQHCKENKGVDVVLVHKIDRLARNLVDYATIKAILKQKGIKLLSVSEPFEDNPVGNLLENIIASISEWYSANLGEEIKKSNGAKLARGEWPHKPPIGYKSIKDEDKRTQHLPDERTAPLVRQGFELFATGNYSLNTLSEEMADRGLKTRYGRRYTAELMKTLLTRRFYIGKLPWHDREYEGKHEPIIDANLFDRVQEVLKRRSADTGEKGKHQFLLRGVVFCRACGKRLTGEIHARGKYYRCLPQLEGDGCSEPYSPVTDLDGQLEALYDRLQPSAKLLELLRLEIDQIIRKRMAVAEKETETLKRTVEDLENREMRLLDEMLSNRIPRNASEKLAKQYAAKRREAESRLNQLNVDYEDVSDLLSRCIQISSSLLSLHRQLDFDKQKNMLKAIFAKIYVQDRTIVGAELNPPFSFLLGDSMKTLFEDRPIGGTRQDILEQLLAFTLSGGYPDAKDRIRALFDLSRTN